jgi:hypothetical protein
MRRSRLLHHVQDRVLAHDAIKGIEIQAASWSSAHGIAPEMIARRESRLRGCWCRLQTGNGSQRNFAGGGRVADAECRFRDREGGFEEADDVAGAGPDVGIPVDAAAATAASASAAHAWAVTSLAF